MVLNFVSTESGKIHTHPHYNNRNSLYLSRDLLLQMVNELRIQLAQ